jgi:hypothetical protein
VRDSRAAASPYFRGHADIGKVWHQQVGCAVPYEVGNNTPQRSNCGLHHSRRLKMTHCAQQIIASAIDNVERASGWLAHSEEQICLSS